MEWKTERKYPNRKYRKEIIESLSEREKTQIKNKKKHYEMSYWNKRKKKKNVQKLRDEKIKIKEIKILL